MKKLILSLLLAGLLTSCGTPTESDLTSSSIESTPVSSPESSEKEELPELDIDPFDRTYTKLASDGAYVRKVEGLKDDNFIMGMDASSVIAEEKSGVIYRDYDGNPADVFKVLSDSGINYIRVRIWNDPYDKDGHGYGGGNNDLATAIEIGKRATANNMALLVDFHYSDFWADPSKQMAPKAWADMDASEKATALYDFTKSSLQAMKDEGIKVGMVQLGNETNGGKMAGEVAWTKTLPMMKKGSQAVREIFPEALVAVHFANPEKTENYLDWAQRIATLDYDVFGSSYYPYWHGTLDNLSNILSQIGEKYNKYTMVMETSYAWTEENLDGWGNTIGSSGYNDKPYPFTMHGQINSVRDVIDTIANHTTNGIGVCYWEGPWISVGANDSSINSPIWEQYGSGWASSYSVEYDPTDAGEFYGGCAVENQAFFTSDGKPMESLKLFNLVRFGNEIEKFIDGVEDINVIHYNTDDFTLPKEVNVVYCDNSKAPISVTWDAFDIEAAKAAGNARYKIHGVAGGQDVYCNLTIMEYNFVKNYSFEDGDANWTMVNSGDPLSSANKIQVTNENPLTGVNAYHWWTTSANGVNYELTQKISGANAGTYKLQVSFLGGNNEGGALASDYQNIYIYVSEDGTELAKKKHKITSWSDGYHDCLLEGIEYHGGELTVGIHVESYIGCWGDIDDVMLNLA